MVRVPVAEQNTLTAPVSRARVSPASAGGAARQIGQSAARAGAQASQALQEWNAYYDETAAKEADLGVSQGVRDLLYNPDSGFLFTNGRNAVDGFEAARGKLGEIRKNALDGLSPGAQELAAHSFDLRISRAEEALTRHAVAQRDAWQASAARARAENAASDAIAGYSSPEVVNEQLALGRNEIIRQGQRQGLPEEEIAQEVLEYESKIHRGVALRLGLKDAVAAQDYADRNSSRITGQDKAVIDRGLREGYVSQKGQQAAQEALRSETTDGTDRALLDLIGGAEAPQGYDTVFHGSRVQPPQPVTSLTLDQVLEWQKASVAAGSESSAVGRYQFIGDTLEGLKRNLGLSGDERFSAALQDRLALELLREAGLDQFKVDGDIERFGNSIAQIWAGLPQLTGDNAGLSVYEGDGLNSATISLAAFASGLEGARSASGTSAPGVADFSHIADPDVREAAQSSYDTETKRRAAAARQDREELSRAAFGHIEEGGSFDDIPLELRAGLDVGQANALRNYEAKLRAGEPIQTDQETFYSLSLLASDKPEEFRATNLLQYRGELSDADFQSFVRKQAELRANGDARISYAGGTALLSRIAPGVVDFSAEKDADEDKYKTTQAVWNYYTREVTDFTRREGRSPDDLEKEQIGRRALAEVTFSRAWTFVGAETQPFAETVSRAQEALAAGRSFSITTGHFDTTTEEDTLTREKFDVLRVELEADYGREPDFDEVVEMWLRMRGVL